VSAPHLLIATSNRGKLREVSAMLAGAKITLHTLDEFPDMTEAVEDGATFEENAQKKAMHYHRLTGMITLADDSGLEVDVLDGAPGINSARFSGRHGDDAANNAKLIELLRGVPMERRTARFRCVMALAHESVLVATVQGTVEGLIIEEPAGHEGFGYDPHFFLPELGQTKAQLPLEIKNRLSHRGQALRMILPEIRRILWA
jgi:XTP/dITP diphosphohydrolase